MILCISLLIMLFNNKQNLVYKFMVGIRFFNYSGKIDHGTLRSPMNISLLRNGNCK